MFIVRCGLLRLYALRFVLLGHERPIPTQQRVLRHQRDFVTMLTLLAAPYTYALCSQPDEDLPLLCEHESPLLDSSPRDSPPTRSPRELGAWLHAQALHDSDDCSQHLVSDRRATVGASGNASTSHSSSRWAGVSLRRALTPRTLLAAMSCGSATFVVYCNRN